MQVLNEFQATQRQAANKEKEALRKARANSDSQYFGKMCIYIIYPSIVSCVFCRDLRYKLVITKNYFL